MIENLTYKSLLNSLSTAMLEKDANNTSFNLNYDDTDLLNSILIFNHIAQNIGIKNGSITLENAEIIGDCLRELVITMTGKDPHVIVNR